MIDTREVVGRLRTLESLAVIARVASTNLVARRVVSECIDNELSLPQAMIIAREQFAGRGRNERPWSSPPGKGIYATTLLTRSTEQMAMLPLRVATIVARFLRDEFGVDARIKWPNDVMAGGKKIAGILIEARVQDDRSYVVIGVGVNVEPVEDDTRPNATSIRETATRTVGPIDDVIISFITYVDAGLTGDVPREQVLDEWRALAVHHLGDPIRCVVGERTVSGTWAGIDDSGRALLRNGDVVTAISAGDLIAS